MQFSRVRLSGFKSFVDPTELVIEKGLTGVVGPNGCGKSNLLEAIRWAMGESSAKSLRGKGMEDVIFSGSGRRPARHFAEVSLVLDNQNHTAPAAFNEEEALEVTRRIERDSGSAYRINGNDVRQKDVQLLFADAATGAHSPALVSQGRIGALINARSRDRRMVLEEAAGISGLHTRRKEAESRLKSAETNLGRVQDVLQGLESQSNNLKRQARQAERYRSISEEIDKLEAGVLYQRWKGAADDVIERERHHRMAIKVTAEAATALKKASTDHLAAEESMTPLREAAVEAKAAVQRLELAQERLEENERRRAESEKQIQESLARAETDLVREDAVGRDALEAIERLSKEEARLRDSMNASADEEVFAEEKMRAAAQIASEQERTFDEKSQTLVGARARKSSLESDMLAVRRRLDQIDIEYQRILGERESLQANDTAAQELKEARGSVTELEKSIVKAEEAAAKAEAAVETIIEQRDEARRAHSAVAGEVKSLDGAIKGLQRVIDSAERQGGESLTTALAAKPGYEEALGAALADADGAGVSEDDGLYFSPLGEKAANLNLPDGAKLLAEKVTVPSVLNRLVKATLIVDDEAEALALLASLPMGARIVSRSGGLWRSDGLVVAAGAGSKTASLMKDRNRLTLMQGDLNTLTTREARLASEHSSKVEMLGAKRLELENCKRDCKSLDTDLTAARRRVLTAEGEVARRKSRFEALENTLKRLAGDKEIQNARVAEVADQIKALADISSLENEVQALRGAVELTRQELATARAAFDGLRREREARRDRLTSLSRDLSAWKKRSGDASKQGETLKQRVKEAQQQLGAVALNVEALEAQRKELSDHVAEAKKSEAESANMLADKESSLIEVSKLLKEAELKEREAREQEIRQDAALESSVERRKTAAAAIGERFQTQPTGLLERMGLKSSESLAVLSVLEDKLEREKRERDKLGAVNLRAETELQEIDQQLEHLQGERKDLETAIARLRGAIGSLNREGRERLLAAFEIVNEHFKELFTGLFGGGEARLELTESDDPLEAGLEIFASPPGKKMQALSLLSGGEQALTALSLIFAVFMTNPAPICILDEVDAPLDDANVERFCNLLINMVDRTETRFLIVTHNAVTMSRMSRLFGVTMAERGVSTLVSVDLERATELLTDDS